jgi:brefeldin A-inhibited guanine nucleotide-exchange protein
MFSPPEKKMMVIKEFESWFDMQPQALVEIFLNFDNDQTVGTVAHNALFNDFCALLCNIAEDGQSPGVDTDEKETIAVVHAAAESYGAVNKEYAETIRSLRMLALGTLSHIQRGLMDASATVHLITKEQNPDIRVNASAAGWDAYEDDNKIGAEQSSPWPKSSGAPATGEASTRRNHAPGGGSRSSEKGRREGSGGGRGSSGPRRSRRASVRVRFEINKEKEKILAAGLNLARKKSIKKCIKYLIETKYIAPNPREVVNWIRLNIDQLDETHVGDYLGEGGRTEAEMAFMKNVRDNYMRTMNFTAMGFVDALRTMLTRGGFRLPGEAQKIDRFIETFSRIYFESNRHLFKNADVIFVLSFSCVMLNTDAHNPGVKKKNKMTLDQYAKQLRDQGLSKGFITEVYEGIVNNEIEMPKALDTRADRKKSASVQEEEAKQLQLVQDPGTWADIYHRDLSRTIPLSLALLKGHTSKCMLYYSKMDTEVVSLMLEVGWVHFYGCVTTILESTADLDMVAILLDHVRYTISACLLLGLETERRAFAALLAKFSFMYSNHDWDSVGDAILFGLQSSSDTSSKNSAGKSTASDTQQQKIWFQNIMQADAHDSNVLDVIGEVHKLSACLRDSVIGRRQYEQVVEISHRFIGNTDRIVNDTNRRFIKEGQLVKKSNSGRFSYTFFLFSDMLLYAGTNIRGKLKVHQYLPLDSLVVIEESQDGPTCFDIKSSVKSFTIVTESVDAKNDWVEEIEQAKHEYESMGNSNGASSPAAALENGSMVSGSSPTLTIDLIDIVETTDAALNYVASSSEDDSDDDVQDINGSAASSGRSFFSGNATSPETPKMYNSAVGNSTAVRQGHFETINAAAAVAASSTFLHTPVPKRFKLMDEKKLDKVFRISLKVSRKVLEDQDRKYVATDAQKLLFYGLFKQATSGDCKVSAPDSKDWINRAKYDAWRVQMGSSTNMAKEQYIHLLETVAPSLIHEIWQ